MYYKQRPAAAAGGLTVRLSILNVSGDATGTLLGGTTEMWCMH